MATIMYSDPDTVARATMSSGSSNVQTYLNQLNSQYLATSARLPQHMVDQHTAFVARIEQEKAAAKYNIEAQIRAMSLNNVIRPLRDVRSVQLAPDEMLNYMMANPVINDLHRDSRISAYQSRYDGKAYQDITESKHFQEVVNGLYYKYPDGTTRSRTYAPCNGSHSFTVYDRMTVLNAWNLIDEAVKDGIDPTSSWNDTID